VSVNKEKILSRNTYVEYERSEIIGTTSIDKKDSERARKWNQAIDSELGKLRKEWVFVPPSNMTITFHGLVLSVPHEVGRVILHRRLGKIIEHEVIVDAVIEGHLEEAVEAMGLITADKERKPRTW
jgi:hypothetical protein